MSLELTVAFIILFSLIGSFAAWRGSRPVDIHRGPRMMPWRFIMLLSVVAIIFLAVHLLNLGGMTTGPEVVGRR